MAGVSIAESYHNDVYSYAHTYQINVEYFLVEIHHHGFFIFQLHL